MNENNNSFNENVEWFKSQALKSRYMLLARLQSDCDYFLGYGNRSEKYLWGGTVEDHIAYMKAFWNSFEEKPDAIDGKPEWLTKDKITQYEEAMTEINGEMEMDLNI